MTEEEKVLHEIYRLVKGDKSAVHLPVSPVTVSQGTGLTVERVLACCKTLVNHGYLTGTGSTTIPPYFYITKPGMAAAQSPKPALYFYSAPMGTRKRAS
ncbi:hypothetical protein [Rufibacter soli]|jgi:hypothetical protein